MTSDDDVLEQLRTDWPGWRIWRSMRGDQPGEWVATLHDPQVGTSPTVMHKTPEQLRAALEAEIHMAARRP